MYKKTSQFGLVRSFWEEKTDEGIRITCLRELCATCETKA